MAIGSFSQSFSNAVHQSLIGQMTDKAEKTVAEAERIAPKRTGYLSQSIGYALDRGDYRAEFFVLAEYGIFVEYGTRYMGPHPYLRPAIAKYWDDSYGFETGMTFRNVIPTDKKLLVRGGTFLGHKSLTAKQKAHVRDVLLPSLKAHHKGAVARSRMRVYH